MPEFDFEEYQAFLKWVRAQYGFFASLGMSITNYKDFEQYRFWITQNKPGAKITQPSAPWQVAGELGEEPLFVDQYPKPPFEAGEGFEWQKTSFEAGVPVKPQWVLRPIGEELEEERPWERMGVTEQAFLRQQWGFPLEEEGLSPYQQWQTGFQERQFQWQQGEAQRQLQAQGMAAAGDWARMRLIAFEKGARGDRGISQAEKSKIFESMRSELLAGLGGAQNWIQRWEIENRPNRYAEDAREMSVSDRIEKWETEVDRFTRMNKRAKEMAETAAKDPDISLSSGEREYINYAKFGLTDAYQALAKAETQREEEGTPWARSIRDVPGGREVGGRGGARLARPTTAPTPEWLSGLYPGLGERLPERGEVPPVAPIGGQAWGRLTPSQQMGWRGWAEYTGAVPEDVLAISERMLPRSPWATPTRRWTPARQRVSV